MSRQQHVFSDGSIAYRVELLGRRVRVCRGTHVPFVGLSTTDGRFIGAGAIYELSPITPVPIPTCDERHRVCLTTHGGDELVFLCQPSDVTIKGRSFEAPDVVAEIDVMDVTRAHVFAIPPIGAVIAHDGRLFRVAAFDWSSLTVLCEQWSDEAEPVQISMGAFSGATMPDYYDNSAVSMTAVYELAIAENKPTRPDAPDEEIPF